MAVIRTKNYSIILAKNAFAEIKEHLKGFSGKTFHLLIDENVFRLYEDTIKRAFNDLPHAITLLPTGENTKSFAVLEATLQQLIDKQIKRNDGIIAIGGGVVGDLAGLVASLIYRGIDYIQVPTTLLAMVDSSIGGKTAINLPQGKNLIGHFYEPKKVIIDPNFLATLEAKEVLSGLAEVLKAALIGDATLFENLRLNKPIDEDTIERAIRVKLEVVKKDPYDTHLRHVLNFGHTYGHAIEQFYRYRIPHGEAVALGMIQALELGVKLAITPPGIANEIKTLIRKMKLINASMPQKNALHNYLQHDKKSNSKDIRFVFLKAYQEPVIKRLSWEVFE